MAGRLARAAAIAVIVLSAAAAVAFATRFGSDPSLAPSPLIGRPVPALVLPGLGEGEAVDLAALRDQVVVVNFFASWCIQCRAEHDDLVATAEAYAESGVTFVGISYQDSPGDSIAYLDELGWSEYTRYVIDPESRAAIAFGVRGVPETFFIAPDGVVVGAVRGEADAVILAGTIEAIKRGERPGFRQGGDFTESAG